MRVLLFGVDGLAFRILEPMMQAGYLPNFQALAHDGAKAVLESRYPPCSPPAWMSLVTGVKPAKHGVYDFWEYDAQGKDHLVTGRKGGRAIWNVLSDHGKRVLVVNVPLTYPPEPINGIFVSGFPGASEKGDFTYPRAFREELFARVPGYRVDVDLFAVRRGDRTSADEVVNVTENRIALMRYLLREKEWDFAFVVHRLADYLQHSRWPEVTGMAPPELRYYQLLDEALGEAREAIGPDGYLFVVSDHGFQGTRATFAINEYLYRHGWLYSERNHHYGFHLAKSIAKSALRHVGLLDTVRRAKRQVEARIEEAGAAEPRVIQRLVPYLTREEELAAGVSVPSWTGAGGGYAALTITRPLSTQQLIELRAGLLAVRDPSTDQPLLDAIYSSDVFGTGPYAPETECLLLLPSDGNTFTPVLGKPQLWDYVPRAHGTHHKDGVFYACGPSIRAGMDGPTGVPFEVCDVMPTVLRAMGLPIPEGVDGRVLEEIFTGCEGTAQAGDATSTLVARKLKQIRQR
jgi:predicted AlkP superfamily phosphohydrolase/phosphomutase